MAIIATPIDHARYTYAWLYFMLMCMTGLVRVGKGRQQHMSKNTDARCMQGMCS